MEILELGAILEVPVEIVGIIVHVEACQAKELSVTRVVAGLDVKVEPLRVNALRKAASAN
jgi:hypothetical protein